MYCIDRDAEHLVSDQGKPLDHSRSLTQQGIQISIDLPISSDHSATTTLWIQLHIPLTSQLRPFLLLHHYLSIFRTSPLILGEHILRHIFIRNVIDQGSQTCGPRAICGRRLILFGPQLKRKYNTCVAFRSSRPPMRLPASSYTCTLSELSQDTLISCAPQHQ